MGILSIVSLLEERIGLFSMIATLGLAETALGAAMMRSAIENIHNELNAIKKRNRHALNDQLSTVPS